MFWQVDPVPAVLRNPQLPGGGYYGRSGDVYYYLTFQKAACNDPHFAGTPELSRVLRRFDQAKEDTRNE
jgi:hypothetical protein